MNKKQLKSLLESLLRRSPNRRIEIAQAIEERLRSSPGKQRPTADALDDWIALCLSQVATTSVAELETQIAGILDRYEHENDGKAVTSEKRRMAAYRGSKPLSTKPPFTEDEIRIQVRSVLRAAGYRRSEQSMQEE